MRSFDELQTKLLNKKVELTVFQNNSLKPQQEVEEAQKNLDTAFKEYKAKTFQLDLNGLNEKIRQLVSKQALYRKILEEEEVISNEILEIQKEYLENLRAG